MPKPTVVDRFWSKVDKDGPIPDYAPHLGSCWLWTAATMAGGYGKIYVSGRLVPAHRAVYELLIGPIPQGLDLDHLCRVPGCVNPAHLEPVTRAENVRRGLSGRMVTHCAQGHEYTPENTYVAPHNGTRHCRTCRSNRDRGRAR